MTLNTVTSGDVMAIIAIVIGIALSVWALLVGSALLFEKRASLAMERFESAPWRSLILGLVATAVLVWPGLGLLGAPAPVAKLLGWALLSFAGALAALGGGGLALLLGGRIGSSEPGASRFVSVARGAGLLVLAGLVPFFGWFAYVPVLLVLSLGAGAQVVIRRRDRPQRVHAAGQTAS